MADALPYPTQQQSVQGTSTGRRKCRKKGGAATRLNPLTSTTSTVGNGSTSAVGGVAGANGRPRKPFQKRDLVEAVRKMGSVNVSGSRVELGEGSTGSVSSRDKAGRIKRANASDEIGSQLRVMETGVVTTSRRYNELKLKADRKAVELQGLLDTLTMIKLEHDALEKMKLRQTPESDRIGTLTAGIEEATREIQGKLHYRRLLNHMLQRLERNKVKFHAHLNSMEESLNATKREKIDVESLTRQLETGRTNATLELQEVHRFVAHERRGRNRLMLNKEREAENARSMEICRQQRELTRVRMAQTLRGDLTSHQEAALIDLLTDKEASTNEMRSQNEIQQREVATMEATFARIRQATGVNTLEEMVLKLANQSTNHTTLEEEKREAESKLARAKEARQSEDTRFSYMKASGVGNTELNRDISDKLNKDIQEYRVEAKMKKAAHERLQNTLAGVKQGAVSLWQRLQPYSFLLDGVDSDFLQRMKEKTDAGVQQDTVKALGLSETLLSMMLEVVSGTHDASTARFSGGAGGSNCGGGAGGASAGLNGGVGNLCGDAEDTSELSSTGNAPDNAGTIAEEVPPMRNNIRVRSIAYRVGAERLLEGGGDAGGQRWAGPSLVGHGGGGGGGGGGSGGGGGGGGTDVGTGLESDDEHAMEDVVPSRTFLKLCSSRQHTETIRKIESDERKKKLAERMETADETEKATLTSKLARKRQQDLAMERISAPPPVAGLPEGVSQRDDVYTKTEAFLTHVPNLD
ncbi:unnamed protein product [Pylaiella littoralis]